MRRLSFVLFVLFPLSAGVVSPAQSQDAYYADTVTLSPASRTWAGWYIGAHLGGTWGSTDAYDNNGYNVAGDYWSAAPSGFVWGAQAGYNWRLGPLLYGLEADIGELGLAGSASSAFIPFIYDVSTSTDIDFYLTLRGRLGVMFNQWLLYGTFGYIGADTTVSVVDACTFPPCGPLAINTSDESFRSGWTVGGGFETSLSPGWSLKVEYLYFDLGSTTVAGVTQFGQVYSWTLDTDGQLVRAGVNYRLGALSY